MPLSPSRAFGNSQPNWHVELVGNWLPRSQGIRTVSCDEQFNLCHEGANTAGLYNGPMNSGVVIRSNELLDGAGISITVGAIEPLCVLGRRGGGSTCVSR